jgi:hypothetical protein
VNRFKQVARTEGDSEVLIALSLCLRGDAIPWHSDLPSATLAAMDDSLAEWEHQLLREFLPNQAEAAAQARQLRFKFDNAEEMPLSSYLRKKAQLLRDAGYMDEMAIKLKT